MATFAPSLMCMDYGKMKEQFEIMDKYVDIYHVDIMDGHFCKNMALTPAVLNGCTNLTDKEMDVHLMTTDPADWIEMSAKIEEAKKLREEKGYHYKIQIDGHCNKENYKKLVEAGADILIVGNAGLFGLDEDLDTACQKMQAEYEACVNE